MRSVLALFVVAALAGCTSAGPEAEPSDVIAEAACRDFARFVDDHDLLDDVEARERLVALERRARHADDVDVAAHARAMLAAVTAGDDSGAANAAKMLATACAPHRL